MRVELLGIGTELLLGQTVDTNAAYAARRLAELGYDCLHHSIVGDNPDRLAAAIQLAVDRSDILLTSGGLGPTEDDITRQAIASTLGCPLQYHPALLRQIRRKFTHRRLPMPRANQRQAYLPAGATALPNPFGTAPGMYVSVGRHTIIALPGVPAEYRAMLDALIAGRLRRLARTHGRLHLRTIKVAGVSESQVNARVSRFLRQPPPVTVGIYAGGGEVHLRIMAKARTARRARQMAASVERAMRRRLGRDVFGADGDTLEAVVGRLLHRRRWTVALAESCTGGLIAERLTRVPGSSDYLTGAIVAYANTAKQELLSVPAALLRRHGAVSAAVATAMANGARRRLGADVGLSVTGIAGPGGGTRTKPLGLVYIAVAMPRGTCAIEHRFSGNRAHIRQLASQAALDLLRRALTESSRRRARASRGAPGAG